MAQKRLSQDYEFAVATLQTRRLIKGYSDTHARGLSKFDQVIAGTRLVEDHPDAARWTEQLIDAALSDVAGEKLNEVLTEIRSVTPEYKTNLQGS